MASVNKEKQMHKLVQIKDRLTSKHISNKQVCDQDMSVRSYMNIIQKSKSSKIFNRYRLFGNDLL